MRNIVSEGGMKRKFFISNIILIALVILGSIIFDIDREPLTKSITSILFVVIGLINLIFVLKSNTNNKHFSIIMFIGLVFAMLGDIFLEFWFIPGAGLFAIGHIFYFVAYCYLSRFHLKDLIPGIIIFIPATLFILFAPIFKFDGSLMKIVCIIYALIISLMVGKAINNLTKKRNLLNILLVVGSSLFLFSDLMLLISRFAELPLFSHFCILTYYPAQCVLSYSIMCSTTKINQREEK